MGNVKSGKMANEIRIMLQKVTSIIVITLLFIITKEEWWHGMMLQKFVLFVYVL